MDTVRNYPLDLLNTKQADYIRQTLNRRDTEQTAAAMMEQFGACGADPQLLSLWLDACRDRTHPDYLCDVLADRFAANRSDRVADIRVWEQVVSDVMSDYEPLYADADDLGYWLKRPLDSLVRLCWRNRMEDFSVTFTLDLAPTRQPESLFTLTCGHDSNGQLHIRLQDACSKCSSDMFYCPDENGLPQCDFDQLEADLQEYVQVYFQLREQPMPASLWIRAY